MQYPEPYWPEGLSQQISETPQALKIRNNLIPDTECPKRAMDLRAVRTANRLHYWEIEEACGYYVLQHLDLDKSFIAAWI